MDLLGGDRVAKMTGFGGATAARFSLYLSAAKDEGVITKSSAKLNNTKTGKVL